MIGHRSILILKGRPFFILVVFCNFRPFCHRLFAISHFSLCRKSRDIKMAARARGRSRDNMDSERLTPNFILVILCNFRPICQSLHAISHFSLCRKSRDTKMAARGVVGQRSIWILKGRPRFYIRSLL